MSHTPPSDNRPPGGGSRHAPVPAPLLDRLNRPPILVLAPRPQLEVQLEGDGVAFTHVSTSASFPGVAAHGALLSMRSIATSDYFRRWPLLSGERGYSLEALRQNNRAADCISIGCVGETIPNVTVYGFTPESIRDGHYPVVYGLRACRHSFFVPGEHPMHQGDIEASEIIGVYVDAARVADAQRQLQACPLLASRVRASATNLGQLRRNLR